MLLCCMLLLAGPASALAQPSKKGKGLSDFAAPAKAETPVTVRILSDATNLAPGDNAVIAVIFDIGHGWKLATDSPEIPASWGGFQAIATTINISIENPESVKLIRVGTTQWPAAKTVNIDLAGTGTPEPYKVFKDKAIAFVPVMIEPTATPGTALQLTIKAGYQACDDTMCLRPEVATFNVPLQIVEAGKAARTQPTGQDADAFAAFDASAFAKLASGTGITLGTPGSTSAKPLSGSVLVINDFGLNLKIDTAGAGIVLVLLLAAAGGFLLNLMPCVLPVIPIKIIGLQKSAGTAKRRILLGIIMSLGVVSFWLAVGTLLGATNKFVAGSQLFGIWWFAVGIGVFIFCMGLGMLGVFDVGLPNWVYSINPKHDSAAGSFGFGVLTAVLALPCVAPFMGTAMSWALGRSFGVTLATFGAIGVGMALPYIILSIAPKLVAWLPRTGPASDLLKQVMGMLMMAISVFFIATGVASLVGSKPYLSSVLHWWIIALMVLATSVWLVIRTFAITKSGPRRGTFAVLALLLALAGFGWARTQTDAAFRSKIWQEYEPGKLEAARKSGKTVVLDFTANWCLNCKTLKATVLNRDEIIEAISAANVVPVEVDLTSEDAPGWDLLKQYQQTGIPLLVIEGPGTTAPWLSNAYTPGNVLDAIAAAKGK